MSGPDMRSIMKRTKANTLKCPYCGASGDRIGVPIDTKNYYHRCYDCGGDFDLKDVAPEMELLRQRKSTGKVVLTTGK